MELFGWIVIVVIIGFPVYFIYLSYEARVINKLHNTPEKKISQVLDGEIVSIRGRIKYFGTTLTAPFSGRKCIYYRATVEETAKKNRIDGGANLWILNIDEEYSENVFIKSGNNYAYIDTSIVYSYLVMDREYTSGYRKDANARMEKFLSERHKKSTDFFGTNRELRYKEGVLEENEIVSVAGKATWKNKSEMPFPIPAEKILVISGSDRDPLYLSDDPFARGTE